MKKTLLKMRGVRISDEHWEALEKIAKKENKASKDGCVSVSDVIRHAIKKFLNLK